MKFIFKIVFFVLLKCLQCQSANAQEILSGYFTSFDNTKIYYEIQGVGKPILLIHGFTGTHHDWKNKPLADSLLAHGYQLIMPDLRGNGQSDMPSSAEAYANNAEVKDLIGLIHFLGIGKYDAVGYSRGSIILARLLTKDSRCHKAVIGGMGPGFTDPMWPRRIGFYEALMNDTISGYDDFRKYIAEKGLDAFQLAMQQKDQPSVSKTELIKLKQQVLIICGNEDADNGKGADLQALIPRSRFVEVTGNHFTSAYTVEFATRILEFLE